MWKYIVTWVISTTIPTACPYLNTTDEYGVGGNTGSVCAVFHARIEKETKTRTFIERDSAFYFYDKGKDKICEWCGGIGSSITEIKIDSTNVTNR